MKITTLLLLASSLVVASCDKSVDSGPDVALPTPAFKDNKIEISLDADKVVTDRAITVTMRCTPLVTGKGKFELESSGQHVGSLVILESPIVDTLTLVTGTEETSTIQIPAEFVANQQFEQHWRVRLQSKYPNEVYKFGAVVGVDSIFIADSNRLYWVNTDVVKKSTRDGLGYQRAILSDYIYLRP